MNKYVKYYLASYNFIAFVFWASYLLYFTAAGFKLDYYGLWLLNIAQGLAVLEIFHTLFKWVKSPVLTTFAQVASRLLVLLLINGYFTVFIANSPLPFNKDSLNISNYLRACNAHILEIKIGIITVSFAWGITELVRYSFYFLSLLNRQMGWLVWMRYSLFIVLYPLGVTGEWLLFLAPFTISTITLAPQAYIIGFLILAYAYYFPVLYTYMWKQRRTKSGRQIDTSV